MPRRINAVRLRSYVPGKLLKDVRCTNDLLFSLGHYIAKMNKALKVQTFFGFVFFLRTVIFTNGADVLIQLCMYAREWSNFSPLEETKIVVVTVKTNASRLYEKIPPLIE